MSGTHASDSAEAYRSRLYEVMEDDGKSYEEKRRHALEIGRSYLDIDNAHVGRIDDDTQEIVASVGDTDLVPAGAVIDRSETYCRRTVETAGALALADAPEEGWETDPAYDAHGLGCYLGATVSVEGETYGTVCFVSADPRETSFTASERAFTELLARMLGRELESERHERRLSRTEAKYRSLVGTARDAILLADGETGELVEVNEAATELTGYDRKRLLSREAPSLFVDSAHARERFAESVVEGEGTWSRRDDGTAVEVERADGETVPVEVRASTVTLHGETYVQGVVRDVTGRKRRERVLRLRQRAVESAPLGIVLVDSDGGSDADADAEFDPTVIYANRRFEEITGYDRERINDVDGAALSGDGTDAEAAATLREAIAENRPARVETLYYRADGTPFWDEVTLAPVENPAGETTHFVGFHRDVTERKRRERLFQVMNRVLRHDIRNGMNVVAGLAHLLDERTEGDHAQTIAENAEELVDMSERARSIEEAVRDPSSPEPRDVAGIVRETAASLRESYPDADVDVVAPESASALATESIEDALEELGRNALEHGGESVRFDVRDVDDTVTVHVADDGPGLPEQERNVLRKGRETPLEHGSGLGLWLVNWVVTEASGRIQTAVDGGTTVSVSLPRADETAEEPLTRTRSAAFGFVD